MQDNELKDLFHNFEPKLPPDRDFMDRLQQKLDAVEFIRQHNAVLKRRQKKAVILAALAGFLVGCAFSLCLPYIGERISHLSLSLPDGTFWKTLADMYLPATWCVMAILSGLTVLKTYELSLAIMGGKDGERNR